MRARTALINTARGLTKPYGERLRGCNPRNMNPEKAQGLSPELQAALGPLLATIESLSERIHEYNQRIEKIAKESYPQVARLEQVKGVGTLIALTYMLTLEDPHRFRKSRDVGCVSVVGRTRLNRSSRRARSCCFSRWAAGSQGSSGGGGQDRETIKTLETSKHYGQKPRSKAASHRQTSSRVRPQPAADADY